MIDWQALGLAAQRTFWFMLAYFIGAIVLVVWQDNAHKTSTQMKPWFMRFTGLVFVAWILVIAGVVAI